MLVVGLPICAAIGTLVWKAAAKLTSIESKVDSCVDWITEQKEANAAAEKPRKRARR